MKKILFLLLFLTSFVQAQEFPEKSNRMVNDYTGTLSEGEVTQLEQKLRSYNDTTSTQVAIVIISSLDGYDVKDYAQKLGEKWGVGQEKKNNGVIILAAIADRKITIQTGYGMEGVLPDAICKRIIEQEIKPAFKAGYYYEGFDRAINALIAYSKGEYKAEPKGKHKASSGQTLIIVLAIVFFIILSFFRRNNRTNFSSHGTGGIPFWMMMNSGGGGRGSFGDFSSGSGSFGGFGGGSFGGGGASGSW